MTKAGKYFAVLLLLMAGAAVLASYVSSLKQDSAQEGANSPVLAAVTIPQESSTPAAKVGGEAIPLFVEPQTAVPVAGPAPQSPARIEPAPRPRTVTMRMLVTAYCPCPKCCGAWSDGKTASGKSIWANGSKFVAADTRLLPFGRRVSIPGYNGGQAAPVLDRGAKIKGHRLDVFFPSHQQARKWGARWLDVTVILD
ncbi:MAG TPA: hypothetical protein DCX07_14485 [Phycisphaerales bacterium]|nr:hypothetical protein [Phycisphaerales bacterium]